MKKLTYFLTLLVALSMLLAACGPAEEAEGTPGVTEPFLEETETPAGVITEEPTEPLATEPVEPTEPLATETVEATEEVTETEVLPPTGFVDPSRLSNWLDFDVFSQETNEQIGTTENIVLDFGQEQVDYIIVESGGFLGIGGKLVAVPFDRVQVNIAEAEGEAVQEATPEATPEEGAAGEIAENAFVVQVTEEELEQAPEFDANMLPELGEPAEDWDAEIADFWAGGVTTTEETPEATEAVATEEPTPTAGAAAPTEAELQGTILASDLLGMTVRTSDGEDIATVEDVVVDHETGNIEHVVISSDLEGIDGNFVPVPPQGFSVNADEDVLVLNVSQDVLVSAPNFGADEFPDTTEEGWDADIETFWQGELGG